MNKIIYTILIIVIILGEIMLLSNKKDNDMDNKNKYEVLKTYFFNGVYY